jgi:hypothetical protein
MLADTQGIFFLLQMQGIFKNNTSLQNTLENTIISSILLNCKILGIFYKWVHLQSE